jgi:hypothetical protein
LTVSESRDDMELTIVVAAGWMGVRWEVDIDGMDGASGTSARRPHGMGMARGNRSQGREGSGRHLRRTSSGRGALAWLVSMKALTTKNQKQ